MQVLARAPVRLELTAAIADLAARVAAARARGEQTALYFVFAGHGEVREGHGYLGLEDSAIDGYFIERELFSVDELRGGRLALDAAQTRAWVADARGERVLDVHKEAGPLTVVLPSEQGELSLYATQGADPETHRVHSCFKPTMERWRCARPRWSSPRAESACFGELFSVPYGPVAFGEFSRLAQPEVPEVFGLTETETVRAGYYMKEIARASHRSRLRRFTGLLAMAIPALAAIPFEISSHPRGWVLTLEGVAGGTLIAAALYERLAPSPGEKMLTSLQQELREGPEGGRRAFARTGPQLLRWERSLRGRRYAFGAISFALGAAGVTTAAVVCLGQHGRF